MAEGGPWVAGVKAGAEWEREEGEPLGGALGAGGAMRVPPSPPLGTSGNSAVLLPTTPSLHVDCCAASDKWPPEPRLEWRFCPPLQPRIRRAAAGAFAAPPSQACSQSNVRGSEYNSVFNNVSSMDAVRAARMPPKLSAFAYPTPCSRLPPTHITHPFNRKMGEKKIKKLPVEC